MRLLVFVNFAFLLSLFVSCKRTESSEAESQLSGAEITFKEQTYDFGELKEGDVVQHDFEFTNTGNVPIEIIDVQVQCGCTVASRPEGLIGVGRTDKITVRFNSDGKPGINKKLVKVVANTDEPLEPIEFIAKVIPSGIEKDKTPN